MYFLSLWICLFWTFLNKGNHIICGPFCLASSMFSGFIHVVRLGFFPPRALVS